MGKQRNKKGFWANLFSSTPKCSCDSKVADTSSSCCGAPVEGDVKEVIVLGPGCSKCKETYRVVERVIAENHLDIKLSKIEDIAEMMIYNIMTMPAVVVDGTVSIKGHVPTVDEVRKVLGI